MKKQTAVEFLIDEIGEIMPYLNIKISQVFSDAIKQAKELEKDQIIDAGNKSIDLFYDNLKMEISVGEQYYNETYND